LTTGFSDHIWRILACPYCGRSLDKTEKGARCKDCQDEYVFSREGQLDLRLHREKRYPMRFQLGVDPLSERDPRFQILKKNASPQVDFQNIKVPWHLTEAWMSYFPKPSADGSIALDLGCGNTVHRDVIEHAGFRYIGLDYDTPEAPILGDAHALPFQNESIEFILSMNVLEHIRYPFVMMEETYRVMKPGGRFIGNVAFMEPFHGDSYYHHTCLGTLNTLESAGFRIDCIVPNAQWTVLRALVGMGAGLFPRLPQIVSRCFIAPLQLIHRLWWRLGYLIRHSETSSELNRLLSTTGDFFFMATK